MLKPSKGVPDRAGVFASNANCVLTPFPVIDGTATPFRNQVDQMRLC
jgi:hypothetical protein